MLKNSKVVLFVTLKSWSGRKILDPTTYIHTSIHTQTQTQTQRRHT